MFPRKNKNTNDRYFRPNTYGIRGNNSFQSSASDSSFTNRNESYEEKKLKKYMHELQEKLKASDKQVAQLKREKEEDEAASNVKFGFYHDSDEEPGGAPVVRSKRSHKDKKGRKRRHDSSSSSSSSDDILEKQRKRIKEDTTREKYNLLHHYNYIQPIITTVRPEKGLVVEHEIWRRSTIKQKQNRLDASALNRDDIEYIFPYKEPIPVTGLPHVFKLERIPYDPQANYKKPTQNRRWENMSYEEFLALDTVQQSIFAQSPASKKKLVYDIRLSNATHVAEKVFCYVNRIKLEDDLIAEQREKGSISGRVDTGATKLSILRKALEECGEHIELRLLEIEILTEKYAETSKDVRDAWNKLMNKFPEDLQMWKRLLTYYRNKRTVFNARTYIKDFLLKCLEKLGGIIMGTFHSRTGKQEGTEDFISDVIVSAVSLYIELGATHKAIGILQALIEFHYFASDNLKSVEHRKKLLAFEAFWNSGIPKIGNEHARGWKFNVVSANYVTYDYPQNFVYKDGKEFEERNPYIESVIVQNMEYAQGHTNASESMEWAAVEKSRTDNFWEPFYSESHPIVNLKVSWEDVRPFLLQLPIEVARKSIFRILEKFGAVIPGHNDLTQERIIKACGDIAGGRDIHIEYVGMDRFLDNIFKHLCTTSPEFYLLFGVSRITTMKAFLLKDPELKQRIEDAEKSFYEMELEEEARKKLRESKQQRAVQFAVNNLKTFVGKVLKDLGNLRQLHPQESFILTSFLTQLIDEISLAVTNTHMSLKESDLITDLFAPEMDKVQLFSQLRYVVMTCRSLPYDDEVDMESTLTKLKFLLQVTLNRKDFDFRSKDVRQKALRQWKSANLMKFAFDLPQAVYRLGDPNAYAVELFATLCYECQDDHLLKFEDFKDQFDQRTLQLDEPLLEVYFKTWEHYCCYYNEEKVQFLDRLKYHTSKFPKNICLVKMLSEHLSADLAHLRYYFIEHPREDDMVKILRACIQMSLISSRIMSMSRIDRSRVFGLWKNIFSMIQQAAQLSSSSLIPESILWRYLLIFTAPLHYELWPNVLIANDQCPYSKLLWLVAAGINGKPNFMDNLEDLTKKAGITLLVDSAEMKELGTIS